VGGVFEAPVLLIRFLFVAYLDKVTLFVRYLFVTGRLFDCQNQKYVSQSASMIGNLTDWQVDSFAICAIWAQLILWDPGLFPPMLGIAWASI
jgi:hypothetical protein